MSYARVQAYIRPTTHRKLCRAAKKAGVSCSTAARLILENYLKFSELRDSLVPAPSTRPNAGEHDQQKQKR